MRWQYFVVAIGIGFASRGIAIWESMLIWFALYCTLETM